MTGNPAIEPGAIKVFGIIHLVFAGLGVVWVLISLASFLGQKALMGLASMGSASASGPEKEALEKMQEMMATMQEEVMVPSILAIVFMATLSVLLFVAGLALVKKKKTAVKASNRYAMASIAFKFASVVLFLLVVREAQERFYAKYAEFLEASGAPGAEGMTGMMNVTGAIGGVAVPVLMMAYPIVALVMLNRPVVKEFLSQHGI